MPASLSRYSSAISLALSAAALIIAITRDLPSPASAAKDADFDTVTAKTIRCVDPDTGATAALSVKGGHAALVLVGSNASKNSFLAQATDKGVQVDITATEHTATLTHAGYTIRRSKADSFLVEVGVRDDDGEPMIRLRNRKGDPTVALTNGPDNSGVVMAFDAFGREKRP